MEDPSPSTRELLAEAITRIDQGIGLDRMTGFVCQGGRPARRPVVAWPTMTMVNTVTGPVSAEALGTTLMHEHVLIGWPGWDSDTLHPGPTRDEALAIATDRIAEMQDIGVKTMVDPCPNDLGRDVELMAAVAQKTGFRIVCATGLYKEDQGGAAYWKFRQQFGDGPQSIAEMMVRELTEGIRDTGIKAGIIKVATGLPAITAYERSVLEAAAIASKETGAPILTHTDGGRLGDEQQRILIDHGVTPNRILVGHSCGSADHQYHLRIARAGSYLGFDRFGIETLQPDEVRIKSLLALLSAGAAAHLVVSHDSVWCWRGQPFPHPELLAPVLEIWNPTHFHRRIQPKLLAAGATQAQIDTMLVDNPRRFFSGGELPTLGA